MQVNDEETGLLILNRKNIKILPNLQFAATPLAQQ
jgi:hypothetical protein